MPYLSSTQLPETLVFLLLPGKSPFGAINSESNLGPCVFNFSAFPETNTAQEETDKIRPVLFYPYFTMPHSKTVSCETERILTVRSPGGEGDQYFSRHIFAFGASHACGAGSSI